MKNNNKNKEIITIRIKGRELLDALDSLKCFILDIYNTDLDNTEAINFMLRKFEKDEIEFNK